MPISVSFIPPLAVHTPLPPPVQYDDQSDSHPPPPRSRPNPPAPSRPTRPTPGRSPVPPAINNDRPHVPRYNIQHTLQYCYIVFFTLSLQTSFSKPRTWRDTPCPTPTTPLCPTETSLDHTHLLLWRLLENSYIYIIVLILLLDASFLS